LMTFTISSSSCASPEILIWDLPNINLQTLEKHMKLYNQKGTPPLNIGRLMLYPTPDKIIEHAKPHPIPKPMINGTLT